MPLARSSKYAGKTLAADFLLPLICNISPTETSILSISFGSILAIPLPTSFGLASETRSTIFFSLLVIGFFKLIYNHKPFWFNLPARPAGTGRPACRQTGIWDSQSPLLRQAQHGESI